MRKFVTAAIALAVAFTSALTSAFMPALGLTPPARFCALAQEAFDSADTALSDPAPSEPDATDEERALADADADKLAGEEVDIDAKLNRLFGIYKTMGACVAVIENGAVSRVYCYGASNGSGDAVTPETCFRVGSIGKLVSAVGLMRLVEQGALNLEDELGDILGFSVRNPDYPDTPVTLRQLMTHTAGLRDSGDYKDALKGKLLPLNDLLGEKRSKYAFFADVAPGTAREYSNLGGGLIGSIIERVSGKPLDDYMRECLFEPLQITAGYNAARIPADVQVANMYTMPQKQLSYAPRRDDPPEGEADYLLDYVLTAGKLIISAPDLAKIMIALCDGGVYEDTRILKESTVREMTTRQNLRGSVMCESGNGLFMNIITDDQVEGRTMYGHGGKANGMLCAAYFDPTDRTGVVMLTNGCRNRSVHNGVGMLGRMVMRVIYGELLSNGHETVDPYLIE